MSVDIEFVVKPSASLTPEEQEACWKHLQVNFPHNVEDYLEQSYQTPMFHAQRMQNPMANPVEIATKIAKHQAVSRGTTYLGRLREKVNNLDVGTIAAYAIILDGTMWSLSVLPAAQRKGIARKLVKFIIAQQKPQPGAGGVGAPPDSPMSPFSDPFGAGQGGGGGGMYGQPPFGGGPPFGPYGHPMMMGMGPFGGGPMGGGWPGGGMGGRPGGVGGAGGASKGLLVNVDREDPSSAAALALYKSEGFTEVVKDDGLNCLLRYVGPPAAAGAGGVGGAGAGSDPPTSSASAVGSNAAQQKPPQSVGAAASAGGGAAARPVWPGGGGGQGVGMGMGQPYGTGGGGIRVPGFGGGGSGTTGQTTSFGGSPVWPHMRVAQPAATTNSTVGASASGWKFGQQSVPPSQAAAATVTAAPQPEMNTADEAAAGARDGAPATAGGGGGSGGGGSGVESTRPFSPDSRPSVLRGLPSDSDCLTSPEIVGGDAMACIRAAAADADAHAASPATTSSEVTKSHSPEGGRDAADDAGGEEVPVATVETNAALCAAASSICAADTIVIGPSTPGVGGAGGGASNGPAGMKGLGANGGDVGTVQRSAAAEAEQDTDDSGAGDPPECPAPLSLCASNSVNVLSNTSDCGPFNSQVGVLSPCGAVGGGVVSLGAGRAGPCVGGDAIPLGATTSACASPMPIPTPLSGVMSGGDHPISSITSGGGRPVGAMGALGGVPAVVAALSATIESGAPSGMCFAPSPLGGSGSSGGGAAGVGGGSRVGQATWDACAQFGAYLKNGVTAKGSSLESPTARALAEGAKRGAAVAEDAGGIPKSPSGGGLSPLSAPTLLGGISDGWWNAGGGMTEEDAVATTGFVRA